MFLALSLLLPPALMLGWMVLYHQKWQFVRWIASLQYGAITAFVFFVLVGAACLSRVDWTRQIRFSLLAIYVPLMLAALVYFALVAACVLFRDCI